MAVKLRLRRMGKKKQPIYKLVAADVRAPRDGRFIEAIGTYNPITEPSTVDINQERALYWLNVGAQPTITVRNLFSKEGILYKKELINSGKSESEIEAAMDEWNKKKEAKLEAAKSKAAKVKTEKEKTKAKAKEETEKKSEEASPAKDEAEQAVTKDAETKAANTGEAETETTKAAEENSEKEDKKD